MIRPRWRKALREILKNQSRSLLVVLAVAAGAFSLAFVLDSYGILRREIAANYAMADTRSATIWTDRVDGRALLIARASPGVAEAEASRGPLRARVKVGEDSWRVMQLFVAQDFSSLRVDKFFPESGSWPPGDGDILVERATLPIIGAKIGDSVPVKILSAGSQPMRIAGTVFDPGQDPAFVSDIAIGYLSPAGLARLGGAPPEPGVKIAVKGSGGNRPRVRAAAEGVAAALAAQGYAVKRIEVPIPGQFPQSSKIDSLLSTLAEFGLLCLALSGAMAASLISSLVRAQTRQIGIMKALGASSRQVASIYASVVLVLSLAALAIGAPLGALAGRGFALSTMDMLNFNVSDASAPLWAVAVQVALGLLAPVAAAMVPLSRGSRISVREALADAGRDPGKAVKISGRPSRLPRILLIPLRNALRRRGRLALQLGMLALGGAAFIASLDSAASWDRSIDAAMAGMRYDIEVRFGKPYPIEDIEGALNAVPGVASAQARGYAMANAFPKYPDGTYGGPYAVFGIRDGSTLLSPAIIQGRWFSPDSAEVVVDTDFVDDARKRGTPLRVGDALPFSLAGKEADFRIVGIMDKAGLQSAAYASYGYLSRALGQEGLAMSALVLTSDRGRAAQEEAARGIERALAEGGYSVFIIQGLSVTRRVLEGHVVLIRSLLILMSILIAAVGALSLASAMGTSVMERLREFAVMRAIGASRAAIMFSVALEGTFIGALSWIAAAALSAPLALLIAGSTGRFIFPHAMRFSFPPSYLALWLAVSLVVGAAASWYPARRAAELTVREVLSYE